MIQDHTTLHHVFHVDLLLKCLDDDRLVLAAIELVEHVSSVASERLLAVVLRQTALDIQYLAHKIDYAVIKVENDQHCFCATEPLFKITFLFNLVED